MLRWKSCFVLDDELFWLFELTKVIGCVRFVRFGIDLSCFLLKLRLPNIFLQSNSIARWFTSLFPKFLERISKFCRQKIAPKISFIGLFKPSISCTTFITVVSSFSVVMIRELNILLNYSQHQFDFSFYLFHILHFFHIFSNLLQKYIVWQFSHAFSSKNIQKKYINWIQNMIINMQILLFNNKFRIRTFFGMNDFQYKFLIEISILNRMSIFSFWKWRKVIWKIIRNIF